MARQYTREFKLEAIHMAKESGNVTGTAPTLGLSKSALWRWKKAYDEHSSEAFPEDGTPRETNPSNTRFSGNSGGCLFELIAKGI